jgi:hypothetical protein
MRRPWRTRKSSAFPPVPPRRPGGTRTVAQRNCPTSSDPWTPKSPLHVALAWYSCCCYNCNCCRRNDQTSHRQSHPGNVRSQAPHRPHRHGKRRACLFSQAPPPPPPLAGCQCRVRPAKGRSASRRHRPALVVSSPVIGRTEGVRHPPNHSLPRRLALGARLTVSSTALPTAHVNPPTHPILSHSPFAGARSKRSLLINECIDSLLNIEAATESLVMNVSPYTHTHTHTRGVVVVAPLTQF